MSLAHSWALRLITAAGITRALCGLLVLVIHPGTHSNSWGIPYYLPALTGGALALSALALGGRQRLLWDRLAALWGAGAWAFATVPMSLVGLAWAPVWWVPLAVAGPLAVVEVVRSIRDVVAPLAFVVGAVFVASVLGSLSTSPAAVTVAAIIVYPACAAGSLWTAWQARKWRYA